MLGAPARQRRMVSLGKVAAPKPINLPSQKKENNGNDPTVNLISKSSGWGTSGSATPPPEDHSSGKHHERAIPAAPTPAWGGAGLPEERKKQMEMASKQEFPMLGQERPASGDSGRAGVRHPYEDDPHRRPWDADERSYAGPPEDGPYRGRYYDRHDRYDRHERPPYERHYGRFDGPPGPYERERFERYGPPPGERERYGPPRHYPPPEYADEYGPPPPRRGYYDGPPAERDYYPRRSYEHDGPPHGAPPQRPPPHARDWEGERRGPPQPAPPADVPFGVRPPPPPPPPRRPSAAGEASAGAAPGQVLERTASLASDASTQRSDSTFASSRLATLGSSMPRSEPGSVLDPSEQQQRQQMERQDPHHHAAQQQGGAASAPSPRAGPTRILKREGAPAASPPGASLPPGAAAATANGVAHAQLDARRPPGQSGVNLPSQASLMDHLASPQQQQAAPAAPQPQGPPLVSAIGTLLPRGAMPAPHPQAVLAGYASAPGAPLPPPQQQHPQALPQPGVAPLQAAMLPPQHHLAPPASVPLMTFGPGPLQQQLAVPSGLLPHGHPPPPSMQFVAPGVPPQGQHVMQFGAIQLPTAIDGSVDADAAVGAGESPADGAPLSAEAQHAYMKQKAAQRARQLREQQQQQQQQQGGRRRGGPQGPPAAVPAPPPPPPPRSNAQPPAAAAPPLNPSPPAAGGAKGARGRGRNKSGSAADGAPQVPPQAEVAAASEGNGSAPASEQGAKPKRPRGGRKHKSAAAAKAAEGGDASATAMPAGAHADSQGGANGVPAGAARPMERTSSGKRAVLVVPKRSTGAAPAAGGDAESAPAVAPAPPPGLGGPPANGRKGTRAPPGLSKSGGAPAVAAEGGGPADAAPVSDINGVPAPKRKPRGSRGKGGKGSGTPPTGEGGEATSAAASEQTAHSSANAATSNGDGSGPASAPPSGESGQGGAPKGRGRGRSGRGGGGRGGGARPEARDGPAPAGERRPAASAVATAGGA